MDRDRIGSAGEKGTTLYRVSRALLKALFRCYNRWEVTGREHVPGTGGVLLIANHTSYADPPIVGAACLRPVNFMAKAELFRIPILSAVISRTHALPVKREAADQQALRRALHLLENAQVLLVFPEGTRSPDGRLMAFEAGAAFLALAGKAQVVPVGIDGADRLLPRGKPVLLPAKLRVRFGPPLDLARFRGQRRSREVLEQTCEVMQAAVCAVLPEERRSGRESRVESRE
jgi:1-acyl-sn-glycerol-3-phosphate acyltransferase